MYSQKKKKKKSRILISFFAKIWWVKEKKNYQISFGLIHFHDFLVVRNIKIFFKQLVINYKAIIFKKALNSQFTNVIHVQFKHGGT